MSDASSVARLRRLHARLNLSPQAARRMVVAALLTPLVPALVDVAFDLSDAGSDFEEHFAWAVMGVWGAYAMTAPPVIIAVLLAVILKRYQAPFLVLAFALSELARWMIMCVTGALESHLPLDMPPMMFVMDPLMGAVLGVIFCFLAAAPWKRSSAEGPEQPGLLRAAATLTRRAATLVLVVLAIVLGPLSLFMKSNGSVLLPQAGFEPVSGGLHPVGGRWMGFAEGQEESAAVANACQLVRSGSLVPVGRHGGRAFNCAAYRGSRFQGDFWNFRLKAGFPCIGLEPPTLHVVIDDWKLSHLRVDCGEIIAPL